MKVTSEAKRKVVNIAKEKAGLELAGWITVEEAAEMLKLTPRRVRNFLLSGRLAAMRVGRTWFIQRKDVLDFSLIQRTPGRPVEKHKLTPKFK